MAELMIIYGDCQAGALMGVLRGIPSVARRYTLRCHFAAEQAPAWHAWRDELRHADVVLIQDIEQSGAYPIWHIDEATRPRWLRYAPVGLPSLWPFDTAFGGRDEEAQRLSQVRGGAGMIFFDALHALLRSIRDHDLRYQAYESLDHHGIAAARSFLLRRDFLRIHALDALRLQQADGRLGTNIGRYILANFRRRRLFHTLGHPTAEISYMIATEVLQQLQLNPRHDGRLADDLGQFQVPIHPKVAEALGLGWVSPDTRYQVNGEALTFEQYQRRYMSEFG